MSEPTPDVAERQARQKQARKDEQARRVYHSARLPERHQAIGRQGADFSHQAWARAHKLTMDHIADNGMVAVIGTPGTGKTQIGEQAVRMVAQVITPNRGCCYTTAAELFIEIRDCYRPNAPRAEGAVLRDYSEPYLLVLDELDKIKSSDSEKRLMHLILDRRYRQLRPTLLLGNMNAEELRAAIGDPAFERLVETGCYIELEGYTFRGE